MTAVELPRGGVLAQVPGPALTMATGDPGAAHIPHLGADTYSVLTEAGLDSATLQRLASAGVLRGTA